jgi:hypothetical protein
MWFIFYRVRSQSSLTLLRSSLRTYFGLPQALKAVKDLTVYDPDREYFGVFFKDTEEIPIRIEWDNVVVRAICHDIINSEGGHNAEKRI